jgi:hypothetical protein
MVSCTKELFEVAALICIDALAEDAAQEDDGMVLIVLKRLRCQPAGRATARKGSLGHSVTWTEINKLYPARNWKIALKSRRPRLVANTLWFLASISIHSKLVV